MPTVGEATAEDWDTEYLDMRMAVGVVDSLADAIDTRQRARNAAIRRRS